VGRGGPAEAARDRRLDLPIEEWAAEEGIADEEIRRASRMPTGKLYATKREQYGAEIMGMVEKEILLRRSTTCGATTC
jgi:preprotein translocase subunit SecA